MDGVDRGVRQAIVGRPGVDALDRKGRERPLAFTAERAVAGCPGGRRDRDPLRALPSRALWIYGFADATGTLSDFLEALVRRCDARVVLDSVSSMMSVGDSSS